MVPKLARETGVDKKARTFSPWSHLVSLIYAQLTHGLSGLPLLSRQKCSRKTRSSLALSAHEIGLIEINPAIS
jgi:hypothetical protein